MVSGPLDVDCAEVHSPSTRDSKQLVPQVLDEQQVVLRLGLEGEATQSGGNSPFVGDGSGLPESILQSEMALRDWDSRFGHSHHLIANLTVAHAEGNRCELVEHRRLYCKVWSLILRHGDAERGEELLEGDGGNLSRHNLPRALEYLLVSPVRVSVQNRVCQPVVLTNKQGVNCEQRDVLVGANITGNEFQIGTEATK